MVIGLISDFGESDYFVGTIKGVIKGIAPRAEIIDICHGVPSFFIAGASYVLEKTFRYFPSGTVFLVVVDPGVGTRRKLLLVTAAGFAFVAPDNGILTPIFNLGPGVVVREISQERYFLVSASSTFEARDRMAPVVAHLATGVAAADFGPETAEFVVNREYEAREPQPGRIEGRVIHVDKFGNMISNVPGKWLFDRLLAHGSRHFAVHVCGREISAYRQDYAADSAAPFMLIGSHGNLEIAMNRRNAFRELGAGFFQELVVVFS
jgi:S-adenosylmethionine hydrolase